MPQPTADNGIPNHTFIVHVTDLSLSMHILYIPIFIYTRKYTYPDKAYSFKIT